MCEPGHRCPLVAPLHYGCLRHRRDREACLEDDCYWDSESCQEPLVRVEIEPDTVLGIDTGSPYTVLTTGTCGIALQPGETLESWADARCSARSSREQCLLDEQCEWSPGRGCEGEIDVVNYVSGPVRVIEQPVSFAAAHLHPSIVPFCSDNLFPQNDDGLVGLNPARAGDQQSDQALMNHIAGDDADDQVVVVDRQAGTLCVGEHCVRRPPGSEGVETRPKLHPLFPVVQHSPRHRVLLDTGTTRSSALRLPALGPAEVCQVGALDIEYLEVLPDEVRYRISESALAGCAARSSACGTERAP